MISFLADAWSMEGAQSNNTRAKQSQVISHSKPVMCPSHPCQVRVTSASSQRLPKLFQAESESSRDLIESSQGRITKTVESFRAIGLQARVNVVSNQISNFSCLFSMKWHPKCDKLANEKLKTRAQGSFSKFDPRLFMS